MARKRLLMRRTREVLRQKWVLNRPHRDVAASLDLGAGTITAILQRAQAAGLTWPAAEALSDDELAMRLNGPVPAVPVTKSLPDPVEMYTEMKRPGVTLTLLHQEYLEQHPGGYQYTQFCEYFRRWCAKRDLPMRQEHRAGEKFFVDYSGHRPFYINPATGEVVAAELFVGVLGASNYTFAEATRTQTSPEFIGSHVRAFAYLGGVPAVVVPDQLKSGVTRANRYEPGIQRTYAEMARHYGTCILPARPAKPRDKAKVEVAVQVVERWIVARLRHETHFGLVGLNVRIAELLEELNTRQMRLYRASRRELFERLDRPALRPLPATAFEYAEWKQARVNLDYHVEVERHYYSVPHGLVHAVVEVRMSTATIELFHRSQRIAVHVRSGARGRHTTVAAHMPRAHQKHLEWTPSRILSWAETVGPKARGLAEAILTERRHPEQGYRSCLGILRLGKAYGNERLEAACGRALQVGARSYRNVETMLKHGLDRLPLPDAEQAGEMCGVTHEHVRGPDYYSN